MKIIQKLISTQGELKLPISAGAFESALRSNTYPATSDDISGHAVKFDEENYVQKFYGRIGSGQFQLRPVRKAPRMEMANFLIHGSYEPDVESVRINYTLSLNPKATLLWLVAIIAFSVQLATIQIFVIKGLSIFAFYAVAVPIGGSGWVVYRFRKMLQPSRQQFEDSLNNMALQTPDALPIVSSSKPKSKSAIGGLIFLGTVFLLTGIGSGIFTYLKISRTTEPALGVVVEMRGSRKSYFPVISYTTKDGTVRTYQSNFGSNPPIYEVGDTVSMYYDPAEPDTVRVDDAMESWLFPSNFGLGGIVLLIIAGLGYRNRTRQTNPKPILFLLLILCAFPCAAQSPPDTTAAAVPLDHLHEGWFRPAPKAAVGDFVGQLIVTICADSSGRVLSADIKSEVGLPQPYTKIIKDDTRQLMKQLRLETPPVPASRALRDSLLAIIIGTKVRRSPALKRCGDIEFNYREKGLSYPLLNFAHTSRVGCLRYSPDGAILATSGSEGRSIKLWDTNTGRLLHTLKDPGLGGVVFRFSPDGKHLAAMHADGIMQFWNIFQGFGSKGGALEFDLGESRHFAFSPDSKLMACNRKQSIEIFDLKTWEIAYVLPFDEVNYDRRIAWHPDGRLLAIALEDRIVVRDIASGQVLHEYPDSYRSWEHIRANIFFSEDGSLLYNVTERDGYVEAYSLVTDSIFNRFQLLEEGEWAYSLPDAKRERIGFGTESGQLQVFDLKNGQLLRQFPKEGSKEQVLFDFHPNGSQLARDFEDFGFQLISYASGKTTAVTEGADVVVIDLAFSPVRPLLAVANKDGTVAIWNTDSIFVERVIEAHTDLVTSLCFSPDGATLATSSQDSTAKLWEVETGRLLHQFAQHKGYVNKVAFTPDGNYLATGGQDYTIWLHTLGDQKFQSQLLSTEKQAVYGLAFSPDGQWLASSCLGHEVKLWNLKRRKKPKILDNKADWSLALGFSGDGKYLAYGKGRKLVVWDMEKETPVDTLDRHEGIVTDAVWIHDEDEWGVFSVGLDDKMSAWTLKNRAEQVQMTYQHTGGISAIAVSPDFKWLATGDGENVVYLENLSNLEKSQELICLGASGKWFARQRWSSGVFHSSFSMMEHLHYFKRLPNDRTQYSVHFFSEQAVEKK